MKKHVLCESAFAEENEVVLDARAEMKRRRELVRGGRPRRSLEGRAVIVVDDRIESGLTAKAIARAIRREAPYQMILAAPVGHPRAIDSLASEYDDIICAAQTQLPEHDWFSIAPNIAELDVARMLALHAEHTEPPPASWTG